MPVLIGGAVFEGSKNEGVAFVLDLSEQKRAEDERKRAEEELLQKEVSLREAQSRTSSCQPGHHHGRIGGFHCPRSQPAAGRHRDQRQCQPALAVWGIP